MRRFFAGLAMLSGVFVAEPAMASIFGEENAPLYEIAWQNVQQTLRLRELLQATREVSEFARETAGFARAAMQAGRNVKSVLEDPQRYFRYALSTWYDQFPELHATLTNAYTARELFDDATHPDRLLDYDAYAYNRAFDALTMMTTSGFETLAHAVDVFGVNDPHDRAIEVLAQQRNLAMDNLEEVAGALNRTGLNMVDASVHTARATAVSAAAQVQATATLERMSRLLELQFAADVQEKRRAKLEGFEQDARADRLHLKSWHLDPTPSRLGVYPEHRP
ncbi:MAG TPA: hypothetical protein VFH51_00640 [Myxococcota bacterium]|nr:hypothetical protein [Myxococcota bacterium]